MASPPAPRIEERWVCIATEKQVGLAAVAASCFQDESAYLAVFEFPQIDVASSSVNETGTDGYLARLMGDRAAHSIANVLAGIQPQWILLLGMTETEQSYFRARLPAGKLIEINSIADLPRQLPFAQPDSGSIACKPSQIIEGFLLAKFSRKRLVIDEGASDLPAKHLHGGRGVVVIENDGGLPAIAAVNYAFAINADVILTPFFSRQELQSLPRQLHAWSNDRSSQALASVKNKVKMAVSDTNFAEYDFATFFTIGVPYGLFIKNAIPCSHVLMNWHCGVFVAMAILEEHKPLSFDSALLFSPQEFDVEETGRSGQG
jgi:hypothetical protein